MPKAGKFLVTWVARSNDPYEWDSKKGQVAIDKDNNKIDGPTLALLFHPDSFLCGQITDIIMFCRSISRALKHGEKSDSVVYKQLRDEIKEKSGNNICVHEPIYWESDDPTDHEALFSFLKKQLPEIRMKNLQADMYLHLSPGTPQMHAIMLLMATSGFVLPPIRMVKTYRSADGKKGMERFKEVRLDISPFYEMYRNSRPCLINSTVPRANLVPSEFEPYGTMSKIYEIASKEAKKNTPVLITGETGTGKYDLASWIRLKCLYCKEENNNSWPAISCGAHRSIDSFYQVLYGDKSKGYKGILSAAAGDTLLLDDIDQLSHEAQKLLIQLLDRADFRLIATTCLSKKDAMRSLITPLKNRFSSVLLELPPLKKVKSEMEVFWKNVFENQVLKYVDEYQQSNIISWEKANRSKIVTSLQKCSLPGNLHDLTKIALSIVTSVTSNSKQQDTSKIIEEAIDQVVEKSELTQSNVSISHLIANAFANNTQLDENYPLEELIAGRKQLLIKGFEKQLKKFVADEIYRLASEHGRNIEDLCDVDRKTIHAWAKKSDNSPS